MVCADGPIWRVRSGMKLHVFFAVKGSKAGAHERQPIIQATPINKGINPCTGQANGTPLAHLNGQPCTGFSDLVTGLCASCLYNEYKLTVAVSKIALNQYGIRTLALYAGRGPDDKDNSIIFRKQTRQFTSKRNSPHFIAWFGGDFMKTHELDDVYNYKSPANVNVSPTAPYAVPVRGGVLDSCLVRGPATYANCASAAPSGIKAKAGFATTNDGRAYLYCKQETIRAGEEIYCRYEDGYWDNVTSEYIRYGTVCVSSRDEVQGAIDAQLAERGVDFTSKPCTRGISRKKRFSFK